MVRRKKYRSRPRRFYSAVRRRSQKMTIPIAPVLGLTGTILGARVLPRAMEGNYAQALMELRLNVTGVDGNGNFNPGYLVQSWLPTVAGVLVHMAATKFGVNRMLANARVPYVRV